MAFDRLTDDDAAALDVLTLAAWCGPEPVPLDLLTGHPPRRPTGWPPPSPTRSR